MRFQPEEDRGGQCLAPQNQNFNCDQIGLERTAVEYRAHILYQSLAAKMGVGAVLFFPSLFSIKGDGTNAAEFAQMKGEYSALQLAGQDRGCAIEFGNLEKIAVSDLVPPELVAIPEPLRLRRQQRQTQPIRPAPVI